MYQHLSLPIGETVTSALALVVSPPPRRPLVAGWSRPPLLVAAVRGGRPGLPSRCGSCRARRCGPGWIGVRFFRRCVSMIDLVCPGKSRMRLPGPHGGLNGSLLNGGPRQTPDEQKRSPLKPRSRAARC